MSSVTRIALLLVSLLIAPCAGAQSDDYQEASRLFRSGQQAQALERVDNFLKGNPKDARARFLKGLILTEQNKPADAIRLFTGLTEDFPELPEPYNNLAVLHASQGQYDKARAALEMAIRTHPSYATAHENLGDIYAKMASQAYDKALQLDKSNTAAQTKLELIKELFTGGARGAKPTAGKAEPGKATPAVVAASGSPPPFQSPRPAGAGAPPPFQPPLAAGAAPPFQPPLAAGAAPPFQPPRPSGAAAPAPFQPPLTAVATAQPARPAATSSAGEVLEVVSSWAKAWSNNDVNGYLGFYAPDFQTPDGEPRSKWEALRTQRIAKPKKIEVRISSPKVKFIDNNRATVTFRQDYRSPALKVTSTKTLTMVRGGDRWLIQQERSSN
ncbi:MAG: tetratricopeptide repeat protein [Betaproteobacteria bacterium]|nr:tetratricopeptide repeat protein [Betaproteobacteria bacterium]